MGTALLLATVVGSGIMAERLADGAVGLALLANSLATGAGLYTLISMFGPVSGAHFNPVVTLVLAVRGAHPRREVLPYVLAQILGAIAGVVLAHAMFDLALVQESEHARTGAGQWIGEITATLGLVLVVVLVSARAPASTPSAVASYIVAAYWFTSSTSFANPAVTLARALTATFAGIRAVDVPGFIAAQLAGAAMALAFARWVEPTR